MKRNVDVRHYFRKDGTSVRHHKRSIDDLSQYDPLTEEWVEKLGEKKALFKESSDISENLEKNVKEMESANKKEQGELSNKITDQVDDSEEKLGKMSDKIDNRSVEKFKTNTQLQDERSEAHHLDSEIKAAKKVAKKKVKKQAKESKKAIKKT